MKRLHTVRAANQADIPSILRFLDKKILIHRHLDWLTPEEWLGHQPYLILENKKEIEALLICPAEIRGVYWIRLFATRSSRMARDDFARLFRYASEMYFKNELPPPQVACIVNQAWLRTLLNEYSWQKTQQVVQLKWHPSLDNASSRAYPPGVSVRPMTNGDVEQVAAIDQASFAPIWQHGRQTIERALEQTVYATVCESEGLTVGYQLSTIHPTHAHIARLAISPDFQRRHLGLALVEDALRHFKQAWVKEITVNTQQDNTRSLQLYHQLGFRLTTDSFPIYVLQF